MQRSWIVVVAFVAACGQVTGLSKEFDFGDDAGARADGGGAGDDGGSNGGPGGGDAGGGDAAPVSPAGCADGTRETFTDETHYPAIAGCQGGFTVAGVVTIGSQSPQCGRHAGNTAPENQIDGCSVADLCAVGWHVCSSSQDVADSLAHGKNNGQCDDSVDNAFWITRQSQSASPLSGGTGLYACASNAHNNLVGCGPLGQQLQTNQGCGPLDRVLNASTCGNGSAWECGGTGGTATLTEADVVVKRNLQNGGALCCRDP